MSKDLSASIENLHNTSSKLNELSDRLSATVQAIETTLGKTYSLGLPANVKVESKTDEGGLTTVQFLGYERIGSKFRLSVTWASDYDPENPTVKPWSDCARDIKLATIQKLPELIESISKRSDDSIEALISANKIAEEVLISLAGVEV